MSIPTDASFDGKEAASSFSDILIGIIPTNPIAALANGDMLAIIFFAIFFGIALLSIAKETKQLTSIITKRTRVLRLLTR